MANSLVSHSVLSFDIGLKRVGLAGCDPLGLTVTPLDPLFRKSLEEDLKTLKMICIQRNVIGLVFGLPLDDKGNQTRQSIICKNYGLNIAKALQLPLAWVNEHSSSWEAQEKFKLQNDRSGKIDSVTAAILLQQWLNEGPKLQPFRHPSKITNDDMDEN